MYNFEAHFNKGIVRVILNLGVALFKRGDFQLAIKAFDTILKYEPDNFYSNLEKGINSIKLFQEDVYLNKVIMMNQFYVMIKQ